MRRGLSYTSTNGNGREYIIRRSISQSGKFWTLIVLKRGKEEYRENGYRTIKEARESMSKYQLSNSLYNLGG